MELIVAILVFLLSVWLIWFLGRSLLGQLSGLIRGNVSSGSKAPSSSKPLKALAKFSQKLSESETLIESKNYPEALKLLKGCFALELTPDRSSLADIHEHNLEVLAQFFQMAEEQGVRINNISELENLLNQRGECELELVKSELSYQKLKQRRSESGKELPDWGKKEFKSKIKDLKQQRAKNLTELKTELKAMFKQLSSTTPETNVYH